MPLQDPTERYPNLDQLTRHGGSYLIGDTKSISGAAIASDSREVYAALIRREDESLDDLHRRLDEIVGQVMRGEREPVNEVPDKRFYVGPKRREGSR
jgi:hypothetical protein